MEGNHKTHMKSLHDVQSQGINFSGIVAVRVCSGSPLKWNTELGILFLEGGTFSNRRKFLHFSDEDLHRYSLVKSYLSSPF